MIKRIIFDLDNTLIMWKNEYLDALKKTTEEYNIKENYITINNLIDEYDNLYEKYDKNLLIDFVNQHIEEKIDIQFLNTFLNKFGNMSEEDKKVQKVLKYLSQKYELVVLTNWFQKPQAKRLEKANILKYFKEVIGGEEYMKPNKKAFLSACGPHLPSECLMIGDNYNKDILGASNAGLKVIYFNYNKDQNIDKFPQIINFEDLERML